MYNISSIEDIKKYLSDYNINASHQRVIIFKYLTENLIHPTVDIIYKYLAPDNPTLSKTTVYNTLKLFVEKGIVKELPIEGNEMRYDINTKSHIHFKCIKCGEIYDVFTDINNFNNIDGHKITDEFIFLKGICKNCLNKK